MRRLRYAAPAVALMLAGALAGCSHPFHAGAAAVVGDDRISTATVRDMVDRGVAAVPASVTAKPTAADIGRLDLSQLVQLSILKKMTKDLGTSVTQGDIDSALTDAAAQSSLSAVEANAAQQGVDAKTLRTFAEVAAYEKAVVLALPLKSGALQAAYDKNKAVTYDEVHVAHILVKTKAQAMTILAAVQADPSKFGALAQKFSTDTGSAAKGGDLGFANRSAYVTPFSDAAFAGTDGTIVGPVQTQFGFHLIKIIAHRTVPLSQVADQLKLTLNSSAFVPAYKKAEAALSISVNPRFGRWNGTGGASGIGVVEASDAGDLSKPVSPSASTSPVASASPPAAASPSASAGG